MNKEQISTIKGSAPVAFMRIMKEHRCSESEAAQILRDTMEVHQELDDGSNEYVSVAYLEGN